MEIDVKEFFSSSDHKLIIRDIFAMYHHKWDMIGESIQNAVDSVLKRNEETTEGFTPTIRVTYNARTRDITVEDNGKGIDSINSKKIVAPHFSLKNPQEANRGEFGVGLTFVAFYSGNFKLETVCSNEKSFLQIDNGYSWAMDDEDKEKLSITFDSDNTDTVETYTKLSFKPVHFPEYNRSQLEYLLRRYTAVGDFWACFKKEKGPIQIELSFIDEQGTKEERKIENEFWHPADYLSEIGVDTVDYTTLKSEVDKGKEQAMPNLVGFGLVDKDVINEGGKEFAYYALFCRTAYYKELANKMGLFNPAEELELGDEDIPPVGAEPLVSGIFMSKKGMPLGASIDHPRTGQLGYWRGLFVIMNCDTIKTEPGRKKIHAEHEQLAKNVAKKIFYKLTAYSHYIIPRDPDEEMDSLLRNVDKNMEFVKEHRENNKLVNPRNKIMMYIEPPSEQTLIGLFHELIGAGILLGYKALKLSSIDTYDGIYDYEIRQEHIGKEHLQEWLRSFSAGERKKYIDSELYQIDRMIIEFKMHLQDIIKDFLQKKKYHPHIKLLVAWDADKNIIRNKGWLLEELAKQKQRYYGAAWRLRPSAEGQSKGILATDVLLLKEFLSNI